MGIIEWFRQAARRKPTPSIQGDRGGVSVRSVGSGWDPNVVFGWSEDGGYTLVSQEVTRAFYIDVDEALTALRWEADVSVPIHQMRNFDIDELAHWLEFMALLCGMAAAYDSRSFDEYGLTFHQKAEHVFYGAAVLDAFQPRHRFQLSEDLEHELTVGLRYISNEGMAMITPSGSEFRPLEDMVRKWFPEEPYQPELGGETRANRAANQRRLFNCLTAWTLTGGGVLGDAIHHELLNETGRFTEAAWPTRDWFT